MTSPAPLLVFDLDGTLADTAADLVATLNWILAREGLSAVTLEEARQMVGMGARALISRGFAAAGLVVSKDRLEVLFRDFLTYYEANIAVHSRLFEGVGPALDRFEAAGWQFAVCTNKAEHPSRRLLTELGIAHRFQAICGQDTFAWCKPDARALFSTIERAGGVPSHAIMVGDSKTDISTAQNAKIPVVAVDFGYTDVPVEDCGPDMIISHFDELWAAVANLRKP
jgi:phosphoglycolate phosphatase